MLLDNIIIDLELVTSIKRYSKLKSFQKILVFLDFPNFYRYFIFYYFFIVVSLTNLLKESKKGIKLRLFIQTNSAKAVFIKYYLIFSDIIFIYYYNLIEKY